MSKINRNFGNLLMCIAELVIGVLLLQIIFVGLNFLSVDQNLLYIIKGAIILLACAVDMRKYLKKR